MPLHEDDPARPGNMTDDEYAAVTRRRMAELGDRGLHSIPDDVLAAAEAAARRQVTDPVQPG